MALENNQIEDSIIEDDEISFNEILIKFKSLFYLLREKKMIILLSLLMGGAIGASYQYYTSPNYTALLTFAMEEDKSSGSGGASALSGVSGIASQFGIDLGSSAGGAFSAINITELMKSRMLIEKSLLSSININNENISIAEYYIRIYNLREKWGKNKKISNIMFLPNSDRSNFSLTQDSLLKIIYSRLVKNSLNIQQKDKKITITSLEVKSKDQIFAKIFCETLAKQTSDFYVSTKSKKARINVEILQRQTDSVRKELTDAIEDVAYATDKVYNLNPALIIKGTSSKRRQADVQANTAILAQLSANLELSKVTLRKETPLIQIIDSPILPLEDESLGYPLTIILGMFISSFIIIIFLAINLFRKEIKE